MGWYEAIKDGISVAQQADNLPLVKSLIDAQKQILDLINENENLKKEIRRLNEIEDVAAKIERHKDAYITLSDDTKKRIYCSCCWDTRKVLVQGQIDGTGQYQCPACKTVAYYDKEAHDAHRKQAISEMYR